MANPQTAIRNETTQERILRRSMPEPNSGCWLWLGAVMENGYGVSSNRAPDRASHTELVHRQSYRAFKGAIPEGMQIMHKCDVRSCVNPDHLQVGTHLENMADMRAKGRQPKCDRRGCHNGRAKLDDARALEIWLSEHRPAIIAKIYGVSRCTVNDIKKMRTWQHIHPRPAST